MVIVMEDGFPDKPINEFLSELLALNDEVIKKHLSLDGFEMCIYSGGKIIKFSDTQILAHRIYAASLYSEHFSEAELLAFNKFSYCTVSYKDVVFTNDYLLSDWFMDYLEIKSRFKNLSRDRNNVLLWVAHFHQLVDNGKLLPPHFHVLYNIVPRQNSDFYSCYNETR